MNLTPPFALSTIDNPFGPSSPSIQAYYKTLGLLGHPGVDFNVPWGTPIPAAAAATVSCLLSENNPDLDFFRAVNTIVDFPDVSYEVQYGHVSSMNVKVGDMVNVGDIVGNVGNTGTVFANGVEVSEASKLAGSGVGSHLHLQVRVIGKELATEQIDPQKRYLNNGVSQLILNGYRYYQINPDNGYNSCVDPQQFFTTPLASVIGAEVQVLNNQTDPMVRQGFITLIVSQLKSLLGIK